MVIGQIQEELKEATRQIQSLESEVSTLAAEKLHAEQEVQALTAELGHTRTMRANEDKSHPGIDEGHADAGKERHMVQQSLLTEEKKIRKESLDLALSEGSNLPVPVKQRGPANEKGNNSRVGTTPRVQQRPGEW